MEHTGSDLETQLNSESLRVMPNAFTLFLTASTGKGQADREYLLVHDRSLITQWEIKSTSCIFFKKQEEVKVVQYDPSIDSSSKEILAHAQQEGFVLYLKITPRYANGNCQRFEIHSFRHRQQRDLLAYQYILLRHEENNLCCMKLHDGDIIKLGREFLIVKFKMQGLIRQAWDGPVFHQRQIIEGVCRICLSHEMGNSRDFLISPCKCIGSCELVHLECLRRWLNTRACTEVKSQVKTYDLKKMSCEICKTEFPKVISVNGNKIELLPIKFGQGDLLVLERVDYKGNTQNFYCINLTASKNKSFLIGRKEECGIVLNDLSISRRHAILKIKDRSVELHDLESKFGTFLRLRQRHKDLGGVTIMKGLWTFQLKITKK